MSDFMSILDKCHLCRNNPFARCRSQRSLGNYATAAGSRRVRVGENGRRGDALPLPEEGVFGASVRRSAKGVVREAVGKNERYLGQGRAE